MKHRKKEERIKGTDLVYGINFVLGKFKKFLLSADIDRQAQCGLEEFLGFFGSNGSPNCLNRSFKLHCVVNKETEKTKYYKI